MKVKVLVELFPLPKTLSCFVVALVPDKSATICSEPNVGVIYGNDEACFWFDAAICAGSPGKGLSSDGLIRIHPTQA